MKSSVTKPAAAVEQCQVKSRKLTKRKRRKINKARKSPDLNQNQADQK